MSSTQEFIVKGMTCDHCKKSVTEELADISGINKVDVDVASGKVVIESDLPVSHEVLENAIKEAGYEYQS